MTNTESSSRELAAQFSLLTPPGRGGIAVFVVRGGGADAVLTRLFAPWPSHRDDADGVLRLGHVIDETGAVLDEAVVVRRGEAVEINIHGGPLVARKVADALERLGVRRAAGEADVALPAAHRAWRNGAVGAELLEWLPRTRGELAARALSSQWAGGVSRLARETLDALTALVPAPRRDDAAVISPFAKSLRDAAVRFEKIDALLRPREIVFVGPPNAGKSSLVNALVGRAVSLVHDQPGTTRDWVRELALLHGVPAYLTDTAGLWEQAQDVDAQAVARSRERAQAADVVVLCGAGRPPDEPSWLADRRVVRAALQMDRFTPCATHNAGETPASRETAVRVSAVTGFGLEQLKHALVDALGVAEVDLASPAAFTLRQRDLLFAAADATERYHPAEAAAKLRQLLEGV
ncbi:MAG: 50S ribosome-binding GTPase [Phycisphaerae bacterium]|nr:50S ribosome-binding GTPase [Phycisphaerae bacterium]